MTISQQTPVKTSFTKVATSADTSFTVSAQTASKQNFNANIQTPTGDNLSGESYGFDDLNSGHVYGEGMYEFGTSHFKNRTIPTVSHS